MFKNNVQRVDNTGNKTEQGQQNIQPEMAFETHLHKYAKRRQDNGQDYFYRVCRCKWHDNLLLIK